MIRQKAQALLDRKSYLTCPVRKRFSNGAGQATMEYLIVFVVLALITLLSLSAFYPKVQETAEDLFGKATERIME